MTNLVLITSVICITNNPLSYTNIRSIYSHKERFEQTKITIKSVKEKIPNSKIFIVECSELDEEMTKYLIANSDFFLNLYDNEKVKNYTTGISKSLGEGTLTIHSLKYIINNNIEFSNLIKISGRYWLSDNFNYCNFNNDDVVINCIEGNRNNVLTALYKLPKIVIVNLIEFLESKINDMIKCIGYEILFAIFINNLNASIKIIKPIGVEGYVAVSKTLFQA